MAEQHPYDSQARDVLVKLAETWPYGKTAAELVEECALPHGQRAGGILRRLRSRGLAESERILGEMNWWATPAAVEAYQLFEFHLPDEEAATAVSERSTA